MRSHGGSLLELPGGSATRTSSPSTPTRSSCTTIMSQRSSGSQRTPVTEDERLLAQVPRERRAFVKTDSWRVLRIMGEFVEGFDTLSDVYNAVTVFGSARTTPADPYYDKAVETGRMLAQQGFPIITGGGPGIMEAANRDRKSTRLNSSHQIISYA